MKSINYSSSSRQVSYEYKQKKRNVMVLNMQQVLYIDLYVLQKKAMEPSDGGIHDATRSKEEVQ